jgi:SET domain-containing protein
MPVQSVWCCCRSPWCGAAPAAHQTSCCRRAQQKGHGKQQHVGCRWHSLSCLHGGYAKLQHNSDQGADAGQAHGQARCW